MKPSTDFFPIAGIDGNGGAVDAEGLPPALEMGNTGQSAEFQESVARLERLRSEIHEESKAARLDNPNCAVGRGFVVPVVPSAPRSSFTATATDAFGIGASWFGEDYDRDAERRQARAAAKRAAREARWDRGAAHFDRIPLSATTWFLLLSDLLCWAVLIAGCRLISLGVMAIWHAMGGK